MRRVAQKQFWHDAVTEKSFEFLQELRRSFDFVLIGGWAVYFYTKAMKSKDIDIIVEFHALAELKKHFIVSKNEQLKKYEIKKGEFDIDIYVPHWSELGLPAEAILLNSRTIESFRVPQKEALLAMKLFAYKERRTSLKGKKDFVDIVSILYQCEKSIKKLRDFLEKYSVTELWDGFIPILRGTYAMEELGLNRKRFSDFKKQILS